MEPMLRYVLADHLRLAVHGAILFAVGLFIGVPVLRYRVRALQWPAMRAFRIVIGLMGHRPGLFRMASVIWLFNSAVMFLYMASGVHPLLPKLFGIWTGLNVLVVASQAGRAGEPGFAEFSGAAPGQWRTPPGLAMGCGLLVLLIELPCLWYALGMGLSMGAEVAAGAGYLACLGPRAEAFLGVLVPMLFVSAAAEAVAVRGGEAREV